MLPLHIFSIALDAMPWITLIYPELRKLNVEWSWSVVEGVAAPENCTSWCTRQNPRLSNDGTTEYLDSLAFDQRVRVFRSEMWHGKVSMCNEPLKHLFGEGVLIQMDSDEIWRASQLESISKMFSDNPSKNCAMFRCRYFVGPDIVITSRNGYGNNEAYEWNRAWRFKRGMRFKTHEPPVIDGMKEVPFTHRETEAALTFDHFSWATENQVDFKCRYYAGSNNPKAALYKNGLEGWKALQKNEQWPVKLDKFLPWVGEGVIAERLK